MDFTSVTKRENYDGKYLNSNPFEKFHAQSARCYTPILYIGGMVAYTLCLPVRLLRILKEIVMLVVDFCLYLKKDEGSSENLKKRIFINGCAWFQLGVGLLGVLNPILAYSGDRYIQSFTAYNSTNFPPYHENGSIWQDGIIK